MFDRIQSTVANVDPEIWTAIQHENQRQEDHIELIASENYASPAVMAAQGSQLTNKYAEGYPGKRVGLGQEDLGIGKVEVAPGFAALGLHVLEQEIEVLHIPRNRAGHDRSGVGPQCWSTRHTSTSFIFWEPIVRRTALIRCCHSSVFSREEGFAPAVPTPANC
jgi:hypothetical protein